MTKTKSHKRLRAVVYFELFGEMDSTSRVPITVKLITALIIFSVLWIIFETEPGVRHGNEALFDAVNGVIGALFVIEYLLRLWAVGEDSRFVGFQGRVRYIFSFWALIDFIAIAPFLLLLNLDEGAYPLDIR